ncbi:MAG: M10 family metallopeptidase C-terminal domain-containing protein [Marinibacterium sp.]|nr:M10 family metallopeptidase C-terminal domain-containing protein [Marinibacterium sp.]
MAGERASFTFAVDTDPNDADQNIDALLWGYAWDLSGSPIVTYSFPDSAAQISFGLPSGVSFANGFSAAQKAAARTVMAQYDAVSLLQLVEIGPATGDGHGDGTLRLYDVTGIGTALGYSPGGGESAGESLYRNGSFETPDLGTYAYHTMLHEVGHTLGLDHGHEGGPARELTPDRDGMAYTVMTYNSFVGQHEQPAAYVNASGHYAQSIMMYDIAAIQYIYGANFAHLSGDTTYGFDPLSGAFLIDGVVDATPVQDVVFRTIWDGGGSDTYDLSNFTTDLQIDLAPGGVVDLDVGGNALRAQLNSGFNAAAQFVGASAYEWAPGHVFNALQYEGDSRSLIENAIGGSGDDSITGNAADNHLTGGDGRDTLRGFRGEDTLLGGDDADKAYGLAGSDYIDGGEGNDRLVGGGAADVILGGLGDDKLLGGDGDDSQDGGAGTDFLNGGSGADTLIDGSGRDKMQGGDGADRFELVRDGERDRIADFQDGIDLIVLHDAVYADLDFHDLSNGSVRIRYHDEYLFLLEEDVSISAAQLDASDFMFV